MMLRNKRPPFKVDRKRLIFRASLWMLLLIAVSVGLYAIGRRIELGNKGKGDTRGDLSERFQASRMIDSSGRQYKFRGDLTTVLFMGIDPNEGQAQADFLLLLVIDPKKKSVESIDMDRDAMIAGAGAPGSGTVLSPTQLGLAFGLVGSDEQGAQMTSDAVSELLLGVRIDHYVAMNLGDVAVLNDLLGGVTVTLEDDFTSLDPEMRKGESLTLRGKQAELYCWGRQGGGEGPGALDMGRLKHYMGKAGAALLEKLREDSNFMGTLFDGLADILVTDMSRGRMINVGFASRNYRKPAAISLPGERRVGADGSSEFHVDSGALEQLVVDTFCEMASEGQY